MHPVLFEIPLLGGIPVYTYGALVALGFIVGIGWVRYECRRVGLDASKAVDLAFYIILAAIIGSRILYIVLTEWQRFLDNPLVFFKIWEGGLVFYGGLIAALAVSVWYFIRYKMPVLPYCDAFAPAIALGHSIGRIGCFMAGCCFGRPVGHDAWYAVVFPAHAHSFAPPGEPLYPTQLMESAGEFVIFWALFVLRRYKRFDGQLIATYLILYGMVRFVIEFMRGDMDRGFVIPNIISVSQLISIIMIAVGFILYLRYVMRPSREG